MASFLFRDEDILDKEFRVKIIREIGGHENLRRKAEAQRRYEMFRDKIVDHVMARLKDQGFLPDTIREMRARAANVSIYKKIIKKKARAYVAGVDRKAVDKAGVQLPEATKSLQKLAEILKTTETFRRGDQARELCGNALVYVHPVSVGLEETPDGPMNRWGMNSRVLYAHQFDVIPQAQDREKAGCIILSDYPAGLQALGSGKGALGYIEAPEGNATSDGVNQVIANSRADAGAPDTMGKPGDVKFIWWTSKFHFTTDKDGEIVAGQQMGDGSNPLGMLPFVELAKDQDGEYWADGGDDLSEGAILINLMLTDFNCILSDQGYGQPVLIEEAKSGNEQPEEVEIGPKSLIRLRAKPGGVVPDYKLVSTNVEADAWIRLIEVYVALLLTTNNLSPRNISGKLDSTSLASGIAKMVDESESTEDITEAQAYYSCREDDYWDVVFAWLKILQPTERVDDDLANVVAIPEESEVQTRFKHAGVVLSESERVDLIQKRKNLGLTLFQDLLKLDNPNLSDEEALALLEKILAQRSMIQGKDPTLLAGAATAAIREQLGDSASTDPTQVGGSGKPNPGQKPPAAEPAPKPGDQGGAQ